MEFKTANLCDEHSDNIQIVQPGMRSYGAKNRFAGRIITFKLFEDNSCNYQCFHIIIVSF